MSASARFWQCPVLLLFALAMPARAAAPDQVEKAIKSAVDYLYDKQADGNWEDDDKTVKNERKKILGGQTALATYALLAAGESPQNPKIRKAVDYLLNCPMEGMYAVSVRCSVWHLLQPNPDARKAIQLDARHLLAGIRTQGPGRGFFGYQLDDVDYFDHSVSQYGVLGLWAASQSNVEISTQVWQVMDNAWRSTQRQDGGWNYRPNAGGPKGESYAAMTAAGVASLYITQDYLSGMKGINCTGNIVDPNIEHGLKWLSDHFGEIMGKDDYYTLYGIERIGVASGHKYFGTADWYQTGADKLIKSQTNAGSWVGGTRGTLVDTCFSLLFLVRGRAPVMMNKLEYTIDTRGDKPKPGTWNERPRDVFNITQWAGKQMEKTLNWQIVNLKVDASELHDAPILYISGRDALVFTKEEQAKLKQFVEQGGIILGNADCGSKSFSDSFRKLGTALFNLEFRELPDSHPIYTNEQYRRDKWKGKPPSLQGLSNGARELMLLFPAADPAKLWQSRAFLGPASEPLSQLAANIFLYSVDKQNLRYKGVTHLVQPNPAVQPKRTIEIARLKYPGNYDPEPGGWPRLANILRNKHASALNITTVSLGEGKLTPAFPLAHLTGTAAFTLSAAAKSELKAYIDAGGTLLIDAAGGGGDFNLSAEGLMSELFPDAGGNFAVLPISHPLFANANKIESVEYRAFARKTLGNLSTPRLRAHQVNGRVAVILSAEDLSVGLVGQSVDGIYGYAPGNHKLSDGKKQVGAAELMTNIVLYAAGDRSAATTKPAAIKKADAGSSRKTN